MLRMCALYAEQMLVDYQFSNIISWSTDHEIVLDIPLKYIYYYYINKRGT